jgi:putative transposase
MAVTLRFRPPDEVVFQADRGTQYTSAEIAEAATELAVLRSMGRTGVCWDNAAAETFWSTLKTEYYDRHRWVTRTLGKQAIGTWIEQRYNRASA